MQKIAKSNCETKQRSKRNFLYKFVSSSNRAFKVQTNNNNIYHPAGNCSLWQFSVSGVRSVHFLYTHARARQRESAFISRWPATRTAGLGHADQRRSGSSPVDGGPVKCFFYFFILLMFTFYKCFFYFFILLIIL